MIWNLHLAGLTMKASAPPPSTHSLDLTLFIGKGQTHLSQPRMVIDKNGDFFSHSTTDNFFSYFLFKKTDSDGNVFFSTILLNRGP